MDATVIIDALCSSEHVELSDDLAFLRTKGKKEFWFRIGRYGG